jgi:response regulator of citrate/malate metabolism
MLVTVALINADVYIKQKAHTDSYYYGGVTQPAEDFDIETWIGKKKMAYFEQDLAIKIDMEKNRLLVLDKKEKTYVEITLPPELSQLVQQRLVSRVQQLQYQGTVTETGKTKTIGKWKCKEYKINSYFLNEGARTNETDSVIRVSTDVPFDLETYQQMNAVLLQSRNNSQAFIEEMKKIKGFMIDSESYFYPKGFSVKSTKTVIEMSPKTPGEFTYSIPTGYTKKENLSIRALRNLFRL